ncbi:MAG: EamA family transporter [Candidatus Bipolaricaulia bacterium]
MSTDRTLTPHDGARHFVAILETLACALIWGSSFVAVKVALRYTGPFTIAGLRYFIAFLMLLPWVLLRTPRPLAVVRQHGIRFALMGLTQYTIGNGALFYALRTISATTGSLALCLIPIPVLLLAIVRLKERPRLFLIIGMAGAIGGGILFLSRGMEVAGNALAWGALLVSTVSFSVYPVLGREVARDRSVSTLPLTAIPLGIGGGVLLVIAAALEGIPAMPLHAWGIILGLATVNTLLAYLLFNHSLQRLQAVEANVMLNLSPVGTALIAWGALGERLLPIQIAAMLVVVAGATLVQWRRKPASGGEVSS